MASRQLFTQASPTYSFAIEASRSGWRPWLFIHAALYSASRPVSSRTSMSAILLAIAGNFPMGSPNCLRSLAYFTQVSMIRCIAPRWLARMQIRSHSIDDVNTACPEPAEWVSLLRHGFPLLHDTHRTGQVPRH